MWLNIKSSSRSFRSQVKWIRKIECDLCCNPIESGGIGRFIVQCRWFFFDDHSYLVISSHIRVYQKREQFSLEISLSIGQTSNLDFIAFHSKIKQCFIHQLWLKKSKKRKSFCFRTKLIKKHLLCWPVSLSCLISFSWNCIYSMDFKNGFFALIWKMFFQRYLQNDFCGEIKSIFQHVGGEMLRRREDDVWVIREIFTIFVQCSWTKKH